MSHATSWWKMRIVELWPEHDCFSFFEKSAFCKQVIYSIQLAELFANILLSNCHERCATIAWDGCEGFLKSLKILRYCKHEFKSTKGPVILWDFGELWKFMADPELIWFSLDLPNRLSQNPTHVTLGFGGWDTHAILHSCGDRGSHLADTLWVAVPAFLKLTVDHRFSFQFLAHAIYPRISTISNMIHKYPQWHDAMKKMMRWRRFNLRRRFADFFGDWGLTHGISILAALA